MRENSSGTGPANGLFDYNFILRFATSLHTSLYRINSPTCRWKSQKRYQQFSYDDLLILFSHLQITSVVSVCVAPSSALNKIHLCLANITDLFACRCSSSAATYSFTNASTSYCTASQWLLFRIVNTFYLPTDCSSKLSRGRVCSMALHTNRPYTFVHRWSQCSSVLHSPQVIWWQVVQNSFNCCSGCIGH